MPGRAPVRGAALRWALLGGPALALLAVVALGTPAAGEVTISPGTAEQGAGVQVTFSIREDRPGLHTTRVEVRLPEATPMAEVYPLSDPDWAPRTSTKVVRQRVATLHGPATTTVTSGITWDRADRKRPAGAAAEPVRLRAAMGPLPETEQLAFTVLQTYSDGSTRRWATSTGAGSSGAAGPGPVLTLQPSAGGGHPGTGHAAGGSAGSATGGSSAQGGSNGAAAGDAPVPGTGPAGAGTGSAASQDGSGSGGGGSALVPVVTGAVALGLGAAGGLAISSRLRRR